jgi:hypothetical protein
MLQTYTVHGHTHWIASHDIHPTRCMLILTHDRHLKPLIGLAERIATLLQTFSSALCCSFICLLCLCSRHRVVNPAPVDSCDLQIDIGIGHNVLEMCVVYGSRRRRNSDAACQRSAHVYCLAANTGTVEKKGKRTWLPVELEL